MTATDSLTLSDSPLLGDAEAAAAYLEAAYTELRNVIDDAMRTIVEAAIASFDPHALVAAGDPAAFDNMHPSWQTIVDDEVAPIVARVYTDTALTAVITSTAPPSIAMNMVPVVNQAAVDYTKTATNRIVGAGQNLWTTVRSELTDAVQQGISTEDLKSTIERLTGYSEFRSDTIARTETMMAYNVGDNETQRHLGEYGPQEKEWLATTDNRTRETHIEANGQVVKFDQDFIVGGYAMPYPGQGPPEETINCRCVVLHYYNGDPRSDGTIVGDDEAMAAPSSSDQEVLDFINEALANNPNMTTQQLLDAYKAQTGKSIARQRFYGLAREAKGGSRAIGPARGPIARKAEKVVKDLATEPGAFNAEMGRNMNRAREIANNATDPFAGSPLAKQSLNRVGKDLVWEVTDQGRELNRALVNVGEEVQKRAATYTNITRRDLDNLFNEARYNRQSLRSAPSWRKEEWRLISERSQKEYEQARAAYENAQRRALADVRDMGKGTLDVTAQKTVMKSAAKEYPTEWVDRLPSYKVGKTSRGYHKWGGTWAQPEIKLSGQTPAQLRSTAVHEIGHGMEHTVPGMRQAEHSFYWERAERNGFRDWTSHNGREGGMTDGWYDTYAGRSYGARPTSNYEIVTMGVEQMFGGWQGRLAGGMMDAEYEHWLLGVMATL